MASPKVTAPHQGPWNFKNSKSLQESFLDVRPNERERSFHCEAERGGQSTIYKSSTMKSIAPTKVPEESSKINICHLWNFKKYVLKSLLATLLSMWDLISWLRFKAAPPPLEAQSLNHRITRKSLKYIFIKKRIKQSDRSHCYLKWSANLIVIRISALARSTSCPNPASPLAPSSAPHPDTL